MVSGLLCCCWKQQAPWCWIGAQRQPQAQAGLLTMEWEGEDGAQYLLRFWMQRECRFMFSLTKFHSGQIFYSMACQVFGFRPWQLKWPDKLP